MIVLLSGGDLASSSDVLRTASHVLTSCDTARIYAMYSLVLARTQEEICGRQPIGFTKGADDGFFYRSADLLQVERSIEPRLAT